MESLKNLRRLLLDIGMTVSDLARELGCSRVSIYLVFSRPGDCPEVKKKIDEFCEKHTDKALQP